MAAKKKKSRLTPLQKEFNKQKQRILKGLKKQAEYGIVIDEKDLNKIIKDLKRPTKKSIEKLKEIKPAKLAIEKGYWINPETGEISKAKENKKEINAWKREYNKNKDIPDFSVIEFIKNAIRDIPDVKYSASGRMYIDFSERREKMLEMVDEQVLMCDTKKQQKALLDYYTKNQEIIVSTASIVVYDSDGSRADVQMDGLVETVRFAYGIVDSGPAKAESLKIDQPEYIDYSEDL